MIAQSEGESLEKAKSNAQHSTFMNGPELRQHLSGEANTSVSFANLMVTIGTATTGYLLQQHLPHIEIAIVFSVILVFASFFASIFYANVTGVIRHSGEVRAISPMLLGNAVTEYFGVYLLVAIFPLTVLGVSRNALLSMISAGTTFLMFVLYQISGYELLSRAFAHFWARTMITFGYIAICILNMVASTQSAASYRYGAAAITLLFLGYLMRQDLYRTSQSSTSITELLRRSH